MFLPFNKKNMKSSTLNILRIAFAIFFIGFGIDKFVEFLPTCSLTNYIPQEGMMITGVLEIVLGIAILLDKYVLLSLRIATAISIGGLLFHLLTGTYDCGGAAFGSIFGLILIFVYKENKQ